MVNIINNNLWSPVPWGFGCGGHHNCGGNNWLNNMFKYQFMFSMMNNMTNMFRSYATPPQQQQSYIPYYGAGGAVQPTYSPYYNMGLSLGGVQQPSYEDYLEQQQNARDYAELKASYGNEFKFTSLGGEYQATLKSDRTVRFSASTPLELMEKMNAYIDQHPSEFRTQPTVVTPADDVTVDPATRDDEEIDDDNEDPDTQNRDGDRTENWNLHFVQNVQKKLGNEPTADQVLDAMHNYYGYTTEGMSEENREKLKQAIITKNPSCFKTDGNCNTEKFNYTKLDLPDGNTLASYGAVEMKKMHALQRRDNNGCIKDTVFMKHNSEEEIACLTSNKSSSPINKYCRALLKVYRGPLQGEWMFLCETNKLLYYNDFELNKDGSLTLPYDTGSYFHLIKQNDNNKKQYELKVNDDKTISIKINGRWQHLTQVILTE